MKKPKKLTILKNLVGFFFLFPALLFANQAKLIKVRVNTEKLDTQIIFTLSEVVPYRIFSLNHPARLVIDFKQTHLIANLKQVAWIPREIIGLRPGYPRPGVLRVVMEVAPGLKYQLASGSPRHEIKVRLYSAKNNPNIRPIIIVIDPGHGGKDPGAIGENGTKEKNVVLAISRRLAGLINQQPHFHAVLTRQGDYFVPLRNRLQLARKGKADLFIAIHADSYFNVKAQGVSVYALSERGASSEAARWLAKRENYSELGRIDLSELSDRSYMLRSVLIDLAQTATIHDSLRLGNTLLDSLEAVTKLHYMRVEQAPFVVLKSPDIPSVLVETGFLSNLAEEQRLRDPLYQDKIAHALLIGIQRYLKKYAAIIS